MSIFVRCLIANNCSAVWSGSFQSVKYAASQSSKVFSSSWLSYGARLKLLSTVLLQQFVHWASQECIGALRRCRQLHADHDSVTGQNTGRSVARALREIRSGVRRVQRAADQISRRLLLLRFRCTWAKSISREKLRWFGLANDSRYSWGSRTAKQSENWHANWRTFGQHHVGRDWCVQMAIRYLVERREYSQSTGDHWCAWKSARDKTDSWFAKRLLFVWARHEDGTKWSAVG